MAESVRLVLGDCLDVLPTIPSASVDAVITDPPAGISFMGKSWDKTTGRAAFVAFLAERLAECLRVAKPGARLLCWAIPRTSHWTGTAIEDAGWLIEDRLAHLFGSGFPKAKSKLKPAVEDWWLARKPGKGVPELNIEACRVATMESLRGSTVPNDIRGNRYAQGAKAADDLGTFEQHPAGRWPANLALSHAPECNRDCAPGCPVRMLDEQSGELKSGGKPGARYQTDFTRADGSGRVGNGGSGRCTGDWGGASRFFYCAKSSRADRGPGNDHPTVKSTGLMAWLVELITAPGELVLDPFTGSGSTGKACARLGRRFLGIESDPHSFTIADERLHEPGRQLALF